MKLKVLTINIWRYYEWNDRKKIAIEFLKNQNADILFFQEVAYDERLKDKFNDQIDEINKELNYIGQSFSKMTKMTKWHKDPITWDMWYGLGILSKFKIKSSKIILLPHINKDKDFGFTYTVLENPEGNLDLINVHFENTDEGSKEHLRFVLDWCKERKIQPIIAGDFNMKKTENLIELADEEYDISYKIKHYYSFMPTNFSNNSEPITLDYILTHKKRFKILDIECIQNNASDHNPIVSEIMVK